MRWWEEWLRPRTVAAVVVVAMLLVPAGRAFLAGLVGELLYIAVLIGLIIFVLFGPKRWKGKK